MPKSIPRKKVVKRARAAPRREVREKIVYVDRPERKPKPEKKVASYSSRNLLQDMGASLGRGAGNILSNVIGLGDYKIKKNVFLSGRLPQVSNPPQGGGVIIRFQEYIGDVITSSVANTFNLTAYAINAANDQTFPFLSQIAQNFETYQFEGLLFEFRSTSADALNSTNTALGSVIMATNYDDLDAEFNNKGEMLNYEYSSQVKPSENCYHMIECDPSQNVLSDLYTLNRDAPSGSDARFYNMGKFQIATTGFQGTSVNIGELHCTYQVRLLKPKLWVALGNGNGLAHYTNATGVTAAAPLGTAAAQVTLVDDIGLSFSTTVISFPRSQQRNYYLCQFFVLGGAAAVVAPLLTFANCTAITVSGVSSSAAAPQSFPASGTSSTTLFYQVVIYTGETGAIPTITMGVAGTFPTAVSASGITITQIANNLS